MEDEDFDTPSPKFETMDLANVMAQSFGAAVASATGLLLTFGALSAISTRLEKRREKKNPVPPRPPEESE